MIQLQNKSRSPWYDKYRNYLASSAFNDEFRRRIANYAISSRVDRLMKGKHDLDCFVPEEKGPPAFLDDL